MLSVSVSDNINNPSCPEEFGLFRNQGNCSIYYNCAYYNIASTYVCPEGFRFNDVSNLFLGYDI